MGDIACLPQCGHVHHVDDLATNGLDFSIKASNYYSDSINVQAFCHSYFIALKCKPKILKNNFTFVFKGCFQQMVWEFFLC